MLASRPPASQPGDQSLSLCFLGKLHVQHQHHHKTIAIWGLALSAPSSTERLLLFTRFGLSLMLLLSPIGMEENCPLLLPSLLKNQSAWAGRAQGHGSHQQGTKKQTQGLKKAEDAEVRGCQEILGSKRAQKKELPISTGINRVGSAPIQNNGRIYLSNGMVAPEGCDSLCRQAVTVDPGTKRNKERSPEAPANQ